MLLTKGPRKPQSSDLPPGSSTLPPKSSPNFYNMSNSNASLAPKKSPVWQTISAVILGLLVGFVLFGGYFWLTASEEQKKELLSGAFEAPSVVASSITGLQTPKTLLLMGVDLGGGRSHDSFNGVRSDTIIVMRMDPHTKKMNIISVPRDSRVEIDGYGKEKINGAFAYGGPELAVKTIEQNFGVHIDDYIVINTQGVRDVVNALGGIDLYVDKPMHYRDYTAKLFINLEPGQHHLNGEEAEGYVRYRHDALGDIGRIRRQQIFAGAILHKLKEPAVLLSLPNILEVSRKYLLTNMSNTELVSIAAFAKNMPFNEINLATIPGHSGMGPGGGSYWFVEPEMATQVLNRLLTNDSPAATSENSVKTTELPSIGILYTEKHYADMEQLTALLTQAGYPVRCKARNIAHPTQIIVHNMAESNATMDKLRAVSPIISSSQLIFSPHGSTFDTNSCGSTDYTLILGDNTRALVSQSPNVSTTSKTNN